MVYGDADPERIPTDDVERQTVTKALEKIARPGLRSLYHEIREIVAGFTLRVKEEKDANGGAALRKMIDAEFEKRRSTGWSKRQTGGVDWTKCLTIDGVKVCVGVEIQITRRADTRCSS